jgi:hypothetical protein
VKLHFIVHHCILLLAVCSLLFKLFSRSSFLLPNIRLTHPSFPVKLDSTITIHPITIYRINISGNMMITTLTVMGSLLAMAPSITAHMIMAEPKPFGAPNNSPLDPSGSDYPCKMGASSSSTGGPTTEFKVGENSTLSFTGSAVHGGGSCQLAVTLDKNPTKDSAFKVIHSIEGGCPGVGGPATFSFQVPEELPNGEAVFAWTWFNKIGNREMYMNCAAITVSGGKGDKAAFESLPDMALANIGVGTGASCKTPESSDYTFENPGKSVQRVGSGPFVGLCGGTASGGTGSGTTPGQQAPAPAAPGAGSGNNGLYTPPGSQAPAATSQAPAPAAPSAPSTTAPASPSQSAALTSTVHTLVTVTAPSAGQAPPSQTQAPAPAPAQPSGAPSTGGSACSKDGEIVCNGESQFAICDHGKAAFQPVAAGTKCQGGKIAKRDFIHRNQRNTVKITV